ncbi:MAG: GTPase HflX, partial [Angelakisella sp.]
MYQNEDGTMRETAILAAVDTGEYDIEISLQELRELADTAEIDTLGVVVQKRSTPDPATAMGIGRLGELAELVRQTEAEMIIFDMELSPAQLRNIEKECDCPVIDRTMLILNIFARHAVTGEGKLQVELAQLRYQLPRLAGKGVQLSRQGGGGAGGGGARRGAGESQLETDKRHLRARIDTLSEQLAEVATRRNMLRSRRKKDRVTTVAIVGYTNVGKSTLLNTLTEAGVLTEDKLFATLDPTSRALTLPDGRQVMLIDTVGLVRRLPHHLVEAFKSTLEEASNADLILNVCDITSNEMQEQLTVTLDLLRSLEAEAIPVVTVLNKCDRMTGIETPLGLNAVLISAKTGEGLDRLLLAVQKALPDSHRRVKLLIPYSAGELESRLSAGGKVFSREYVAEGVELDINLVST